MQEGQLIVAELDLLDDLAELREVEAPLLLASFDQCGDLILAHTVPISAFAALYSCQISPQMRAALGHG